MDIVKRQKLLTIAMCRDGEPYLITADYGFDDKDNCFYIHCAKRGKKIDFLRANPRVWGTIVEDLGYVQGECEHHYRSVHFEGKAELVTDLEQKRKALELMIDFLEDDPEKGKREFITKTKFLNTMIIKIRASRFTGKSNAPRDKR
ncbi:MAG: pyridoxamine 5'-phosphate oxidase family protein [Thermoplasmata archaeon]